MHPALAPDNLAEPNRAISAALSGGVGYNIGTIKKLEPVMMIGTTTITDTAWLALYSAPE